MSKYSILIIDDDKGLIEPLKEYFARYELALEYALHPDRGMERLTRENFDLVILDIMLPDRDGFSLCKEIRQFSNIPIIMLTARGDITDRVVGLEIGADDYLPKPFDPRELVARIYSILKRASAQKDGSTQLRQFNTLSIDTSKQLVSLGNKGIELTTNEYALVDLLSSEPQKVFTRDEIMNALKGIDADVYSRSIDILISRTRKKLEPEEPIKTVWGRGYQWLA